ncbi:hypothetical protein [Lysobacter gummosus]|uniref:hypothetical protein n=1 Tax=Lysobacter gummosus TaxID=262324 RepID=UPI003632D183
MALFPSPAPSFDRDKAERLVPFAFLGRRRVLGPVDPSAERIYSSLGTFGARGHGQPASPRLSRRRSRSAASDPKAYLVALTNAPKSSSRCAQNSARLC